MYEYELPDESSHVTQRLCVVLDVTTDGCGVTYAMRNVALQAARDAVERFNLVVKTVPVRTELDGLVHLEL